MVTGSEDEEKRQRWVRDRETGRAAERGKVEGKFRGDMEGERERGRERNGERWEVGRIF